MPEQYSETDFIERASKAVFELIYDTGKLLRNWNRREAEIQRACLNFCRRYVDEYGYIKILGMGEKAPLYELYTGVRFLDPRFLAKQMPEGDLDSALRTDGEHYLSFDENASTTVLDGIEVANNVRFLNVLGQPGAGKSTFLRRLGLEALLPYNTFERILGHSVGQLTRLSRNAEYSKYHHNCLPILIELKDFKTAEVNIQKKIVEELRESGFPNPQGLLEEILRSGRLLLLMDGLDEVPEYKLHDVISEVKSFVYMNRSNRFLTSCRTRFYNKYFPNFTDVILADFDGMQIDKFIRNWFNSKLDHGQNTADDLLSLLKNPSHRATLDLARTPLLLTFICLTYDADQSLQANRSLLYQDALHILLTKWAADKRIRRDEIYKGLNSTLELLMLAQIASTAFINDKRLFKEEELVQQIESFLRERLQTLAVINGEKILEAIAVYQGLLVQRAYSWYSFSHLTIQEFLTAYQYRDSEQFFKLVADHLFKPRWREVFLLVAGLTPAADLLLASMTTNACNLVATSSRLAEFYTSMPRNSHFFADGELGAVNRGVAWLFGATIAALVNRSKGSNKSNGEVALILDDVRQALTSLILLLCPTYPIDPVTRFVGKFANRSERDSVICNVISLIGLAEAIDIFKDRSGAINKSLEVLRQSSFAGDSRVDAVAIYISIIEALSDEISSRVSLFEWTAADAQICLNNAYATHLIIDCKGAAAGNATLKEWQRIVELLLSA